MQIPILKRLWSMRGNAVGAVLHWSGAGRLFEMTTRPTGAIILAYHSVATGDAANFVDPSNRISPDLFERQMAFLSKHRTVIPLSQLVEQIASGVSSPAGTVCITFDDGYLDNLTTAAPILEKYRLPAMLFLATGYVSRSETQWADRLWWLLEHRTSDRLSIPSCGLAYANLDSPAKREVARKRLHGQLLISSHEDRVRLLDQVKQHLAPAGKPPRLTMNWSEVRELRRRYPFFEIGGHTRDHIDLRTHRGKMARSQIADCAEDIRRELGTNPEHFSFPYARWSAETRDDVLGLGWKSAVGMGNGVRIGHASDRFAMPRVESPLTMTELRFKTSGAYPGAFSIIGLT